MDYRIRSEQGRSNAEERINSKDEKRSSGRLSRLEKACAYVKRMWFPINRVFYDKLKKGVEEGLYDLDLDFLLLELKTDFALFTRCLQYLSEMLDAEEVTRPASINPIQLMHLAGIDRLKEILLDESLFVTTHSFESISPEQSKRFQETVISTNTAEIISELHNLDPEVGFSVGLLRQLGLTLIAWNYPSAYSRVLSNLDEGINLDDALSRVLGFSPSLLAASLVKEWGLGAEIANAVSNSELQEGETSTQRRINEASKTLREICEVGEALARANDPDTYPTAVSDWKHATKEIRSYLGGDGIRQIQSHIKENIKNYMAAYPEICEEVIELNPGKKIEEFQRKNSSKLNPFLADCRPILRKNLEKFYRLIISEEIQAENIKFLVQQVFPLAGFNGGCIYIIDPTSERLIPRMKCGEMQLQSYTPVNCSPGTTDSSPISTAFFCNIPIMGSDETVAGETSYISGILGNKKKAGVLYLEIKDKDQNPGEEIDYFNNFKAVRQALCDGLKLS